MDPARMFTEGLTPHPELENSLGPQQRKSRSASMSAVGGVSGLIMLALSLAAGDPYETLAAKFADLQQRSTLNVIASAC
jgi:hypothetical protein